MAFSCNSAPLKVIVLIGLAMAVAMPFARRDDWIGWIALLTMAAVAVGLWAWLIGEGPQGNPMVARSIHVERISEQMTLGNLDDPE